MLVGGQNVSGLKRRHAKNRGHDATAWSRTSSLDCGCLVMNEDAVN